MFSKIKKRASAVRFAFSFKVGTLAPWPNGNKSCAIGWQRGSSAKKRGATEPHLPELVPGQLGTAVKFDEVIQLSATLYMEGGAKANPSGPFKKKCLIFAVLETDSRGRRTESSGRVVIDLAEFASIQNETTREFPVACSKTIQAAVGEPILGVTVRSSWKGASGPGSGGSFASSLSSDATGGTLTSQLSSLMRSGQPTSPSPLHGGMTGDQMDELRAFDRLRTINESESEYRTRTSSKSEIMVPPQVLEGVAEEAAAAAAGRYDDDGFMVDSDEEEVAAPPPKQSNKDSQVQAIGGAPPPSKDSDRISSWLSAAERQPDSPENVENGKNAKHEDEDPAAGRPGTRSPESESYDDAGTGLSGLSTPAKSGEEIIASPTVSEGGENGSSEPPLPNPPAQMSDTHDRRFARRPNSGIASDEDRSAAPPPIRPHRENDDARNLQTENPVASANEERQEAEHAGLRPSKSSGHGANHGEESGIPRRWRRVHEERALPKEAMPGKDISPFLSQSPKSPDNTPSSKLESSPFDGDIQSQLRNAAFLEASVYLARSGRSQFKSRNTHAPARRIIRTLAALGPDQGVAVTKDALQAIRSMVKGCGADVSGMAYWWSNCVHMRFLLPHVASGGSRSGTPRKNSVPVRESHWAMKGILQVLTTLEKEIYNRIQQYLWWKVLMPLVADQGRRGRISPGRAKSNNEIAVHRWLDALHAVYDQFLMSPSGKGNEGHVSVLKTQVLRNCCQRIDAMLYQELTPVQGADGFGAANHSDASFVDEILGVDPDSLPPLDDAVLPFTRGKLSFGAGMHIKMAVTRWVEWAFEVDVKEEAGQPLFPLLKATADLLMMPKELLTDASVRMDVFSALSTRSMCALLERYTPDDFAPDPIDTSVLENLKNLPQSQPIDSPRTHLVYQPPSDRGDPVAELTSSSRSNVSFKSTNSFEEHPLSYEFDSVSEDELDSLSAMYEGEVKGETPSRFKLLKELWVERRDRRLGRGSR
ncbi:hypothetical protein BSKO_12584 [Bryopsis sp. KO-2023]|nr:hypothetical protein BSKO_12584 [Bryopsis sp. KO-2023]